jgi:hypothetical protein
MRPVRDLAGVSPGRCGNCLSPLAKAPIAATAGASPGLAAKTADPHPDLSFRLSPARAGERASDAHWLASASCSREANDPWMRKGHLLYAALLSGQVRSPPLHTQSGGFMRMRCVDRQLRYESGVSICNNHLPQNRQSPSQFCSNSMGSRCTHSFCGT